MKILVLGGTGAMGVYLVELLADAGNEVCVTSRKEKKSSDKISYIQGDAHNYQFVIELLKNKYDAIVDFMAYHTKEFEERAELFLQSTDQYIFISSSRVYAEHKNRIVETSHRLLDLCDDTDYFKSDEYALTKARQENLLFNSECRNWTIIRPYITYGNERFQLGVYEKEDWLYRALNGRAIVFSKDVAEKYTTLTYGYDVATVMARLIGNRKAYGQAFNITSEESMKWKDILEIYINIIEKATGIKQSIVLTDDSMATGTIGNQSQLIYDRLYNRTFSNEKLSGVLGYNFEFVSVEEGLEKCILNFIVNGKKFKRISWKWEARKDRIAHIRTPLKAISNNSDKIKYIIFRYLPVIGLFLEKLKNN